VIVSFVSVILRYVFATGWVWVADLIQWPHGAAFMLAAGYTLLHKGHVRVDIFYANATRRRQAWTDLAGTFLFLLPWTLYVAWIVFPAIGFSWKFMEASTNPGGLPARYLFKSSVGLFTILLSAQGIALALRSVLVLVGREDLMADADVTPAGPNTAEAQPHDV
jgi:TRAP-type mannitol/chloroaromatic compound transport system permease small subunit